MPRHLLALSAVVLALVCALPAAARAQAPAPTAPPGRFQAGITWLYYRDLPAAMRFYERVMGLTLTVDQGWAKVYQVSPTSFVGLVDETRGMHRASETKPVALAFVTDRVDDWHRWLVSQGVKVRGESKDSANLPIRGFVAIDPEGYTLEFETFRDDPMNTTIRRLLAAPRPQ
jgi:predicted enzyme related to lactoylglutathione lyase